MQKSRKPKEEIFVKKGENPPEGEQQSSPAKDNDQNDPKRKNQKKRGGPPRSGKPQRDHEERFERVRFKYPEGWQDKIREEVTLETKVPENPKADQLIPKPNLNDFKDQIEKLNKQIEAISSNQQKIKKNKEAFVSELFDKNKSIYKQLSEKHEQRNKEFIEPLKKLRVEKDKIKEELSKVNEKLSLISKKTSGKFSSKDQLLAEIKEKEAEFNRNQYKAIEEVKVLDAIQKLKDQLEFIDKLDVQKKKEDALNKKRKEIQKQIEEIEDKMAPLNAEIAKIKEAAGIKDKERKEAQEKQKEQKEQQKEEPADQKKEKVQRQKTKEELEFDTQLDSLYDERNKIKEQKQALNKKFDENMLKYEEQQFEIRKLEEKRKYQGYLRREENRKKEKEEWEKYQVEQKQKENEKLKFKYQTEIDQCNKLIKLLEELIKKPEESANKEATPQESKPKPAQDSELGQPLVGKKAQFKDVPVVKPKKADQKKKNTEPEKKKLFTDLSVITLFAQFNVIAPTNPVEAEQSLKDLKQKIEDFEKMRAEEIAEAEKESQKKEGAKEGKEEKAEAKEGEEGDGEKPKKEKRAPIAKEEPRKVLKEEDFPSL